MHGRNLVVDSAVRINKILYFYDIFGPGQHFLQRRLLFLFWFKVIADDEYHDSEENVHIELTKLADDELVDEKMTYVYR